MSGTRMISRANLPCQPSPQTPPLGCRAPRRCARQRGSGVLAACRRSGTSIINKRRDGASPFDPYLAVREQRYTIDEVGADGEAETIAEVDALPVAVSAARGPVGDLVSWLLVVGRWFGRWQHHWSRREAHHRWRICRRRNVIRRRGSWRTSRRSSCATRRDTNSRASGRARRMRRWAQGRRGTARSR